MKVFLKTKVFDENLIASVNEQFHRVFDHLIFVKCNDAMNCNRANTSTTYIFTYREKSWSHCLPVKLDFHRQHMCFYLQLVIDISPMVDQRGNTRDTDLYWFKHKCPMFSV